jgi:hypothetical protein
VVLVANLRRHFSRDSAITFSAFGVLLRVLAATFVAQTVTVFLIRWFAPDASDWNLTMLHASVLCAPCTKAR